MRSDKSTDVVRAIEGRWSVRSSLNLQHLRSCRVRQRQNRQPNGHGNYQQRRGLSQESVQGWLAEAPCSPPRTDGPLRELGRETNRLPGQEGQKSAYSGEETHQIETGIGGRRRSAAVASGDPGTRLWASAGRTVRDLVGSEVVGSNPSLDGFPRLHQ
jgi:hypothetical protein